MVFYKYKKICYDTYIILSEEAGGCFRKIEKDDVQL